MRLDTRYNRAMEFRILGPLEVVADGAPVAIGSAKQRTLLGVLLLHAHEVVSTDALVDALWGERPPATAGKLVQVYVSQLRRALSGNDVLQTRAPGYVAVVEPEQLDASRFTALVAEARERSDADEAVAAYDAALALWRGPVLADVEHEAHARVEVERLEELRLAALGERIAFELDRGRHARVIAELESLTAEHPLHERFWAQLMVALYGAGRQSEALAAYQRARRALLDRVGLQPGPELRRLEKAILSHEPSLEATAPAPAALPPPGRRLRRRRVLTAAAIAAVAAAAAVTVVVAPGGGRRPAAAHVVSDSVAVVDPRTNRLVRDIRLHTRPSGIAVGSGSVWVGGRDDRTLLRLDPRSGRVTKAIGLGAEPTAIAAGDGYVWVVSAPARTLFQFDADTETLVRTRVFAGRVRVGPLRGQPLPPPFYLAVGAGAVWVAHGGGVVSRVDERTGAVVQIPAFSAGGVAFGEGAVWSLASFVSEPARSFEVSRIDPRTRAVTGEIPPPSVGVPESSHPFGIAAGIGAVWVLDGPGSSVWKLDPTLERTTAVLPLRPLPVAAVDLVAAADAVWVAHDDGTLSRIEERHPHDPARPVPTSRLPRPDRSRRRRGLGDDAPEGCDARDRDLQVP